MKVKISSLFFIMAFVVLVAFLGCTSEPSYPYRGKVLYPHPAYFWPEVEHYAEEDCFLLWEHELPNLIKSLSKLRDQTEYYKEAKDRIDYVRSILTSRCHFSEKQVSQEIKNLWEIHQ